jgi:hypothetical protein
MDTTTGLGGQTAGFYRCAANDYTYLLSTPTTVADFIAPTNTRASMRPPGSGYYMPDANGRYFIGTISTSNCVTRWGTQDVLSPNIYGSVQSPMADTFLFTSSSMPATFVPIASDVDSGVVYDWGTLVFDGVSSMPSPQTTNGTSAQQLLNLNNSASFRRYNPVLGVPILSNNSLYPLFTEVLNKGALGVETTSSTSSTNAQIDQYSNYNDANKKFILLDGRYHRFSYNLGGEGVWRESHAWCVQEAE